MVLKSLLILLLLPMFSFAKDLPGFYKGNETIEYDVISSAKFDGYIIDTRSLKKDLVLAKIKEEESEKNNFLTLFRYIEGKNAENLKINMTTPVIKKIDKEQEYGLSFILTKNFKQATDAPVPDDKSIEIINQHFNRFLCVTFGGFVRHKKFEQMLDLVLDYAKENSLKVSGNYYAAIYDSPMTLFNRRNEIWVELKE